ncbi:uncharacterized protein LOC113513253 [Galleria mellonella]|uniref:Guanylate cyclase n=1 Tax=Galleria mellonella TaxID=7137 RepID=A0A6J3CFU5_GALME|nr:uncharacterized protein LOC113513253 [Galleria mellonella]
MRALPPLLLVVAAVLAAATVRAAAAAAAAPATAAPALLVLRAACDVADPSLFTEQRLENYAAMTERNIILQRRSVRILSYKKTCGKDWKVEVTRSALMTIGGGGAVSFAGWAGTGVCEALTAAARVLRRPLPGVCGSPAARGTAVVQLAVRLRWRRVLLSFAPSRPECLASLREIERALISAGLAVRYAQLSSDELARRPHVVILCASFRSEPAIDIGALHASAGAMPVVLIVHIDEYEPPPKNAPADPSAATVTIDDSNDAFQMSNITLDIRNSPYKRKRDNTPPSLVTSLPENANLSSVHPEPYKKTFLSPSPVSLVNNIVSSLDHNNKTRFVSKRSQLTYTTVFKEHREVNKIKTSIIEKLLQNNTHGIYISGSTKQTFTNNKSKADPEVSIVRGRRTPRGTWNDVPTAGYEKFNILVSQLDYSIQRRMLFLSDKRLETEQAPVIADAIYEEILEALHQDTEAERTRTESGRMAFFLYDITFNNLIRSGWRCVALLATVSTRSLDKTDEWHTVVEIINSTRSFDIWSEEYTGDHDDVSLGLTMPILVTCVVAALIAAVALILIARWLAVRRRRRRRRGDAVLVPSDFTFPADERRRVGEGMETMLSCWLQQLHEFGGPELEPPDLLKQPPRATPREPSAPSSTCSINRVAVDRRTRYRGDAVHMKYLPVVSLELKRKATDVVLVMQNLRHENLNPFIGCLCEVRPALVFDQCGRGSLEDVLMADDIKLDWTFRLSLLTDLVKGMRYLHASPLRVHGRLTSRNCVVDSRWVLRLTDYGLPSFYRAQGLPQPQRSSRDLLWTAPELLREGRGGGRGSQPGDVFSFAIIMQEVIVRGEPYCMLALTPDEIVEKVMRPPPLIRPSVSMGAAPPEAVSVMRQCWSEAPDLRPDFHRLHDIFRHLHRGRKINIVDSMFEMLEKYSNNLEELIRERTEQLDMEKKKTEQLLNRMLPRSVAERLMLGSRVEPEEFEEVSIYFSDIVGFTGLAARSTPVQVVDLLNDLYTTFDAAIEQYRVYKVETIGDAYMVVGGLPARCRDHAESVATMALHLLHLAGRFRVRHLPATPLHLRIGLHTGPCCAGVVGLTMPRYCLFGDTVNTASRMESTGAAWRIQISAATAERLSAAGGYRLRSRGLTQIKGKGAMHTYWLLGKEGFDKPLPTPPPLESEEVLFETDGENESESSSAPSATPVKSSQVIERQRSDPTSTHDKYAWQRSGAMSADSSPPRAPRAASAVCVGTLGTSGTLTADHSAPYARYRCLPSGSRVLRRQWSLERGEALAAAAGARRSAGSPPQPAAAPAAPGAPAAPTAPPPEPLALVPAAPRAPPARYRTRPAGAAPPADDDSSRPRPP